MVKGSNTSSLQSQLMKHYLLQSHLKTSPPVEVCKAKRIKKPTMGKGKSIPKAQNGGEAAGRFGNPLLGEGHDAYLSVTIPSLYTCTQDTVTTDLFSVEYFAATAGISLASYQTRS